VTTRSKGEKTGRLYFIVMSSLLALGFLLCMAAFIMRALVNGHRDLEQAADTFASYAFGGTALICIFGMVMGAMAGFYEFVRTALEPD